MIFSLTYFITTRRWGVVMFSVASVCVCVCLFVCVSVCNALTSDSFGLESSFLVCSYIFRISRLFSYNIGHQFKVKVTGANKHVCVSWISNALIWNIHFGVWLHLWIGIYGSGSCNKVIRSRSRSQDRKSVLVNAVCRWYTFDWKVFCFKLEVDEYMCPVYLGDVVSINIYHIFHNNIWYYQL